MSKFDFDIFYGGYDNLAVSKEKYSKEQAIEIAKRELEYSGKQNQVYLAIGNGYARHRAGRNEDGECCVGWWLEYEEHKRSCPCWVFHVTPNDKEHFFKDYEYIPLNCHLVKEGEIVEKHYCDVCGTETPAGHRKVVVEIEQILEGAGLEDICCNCLEKAKQVPWTGVVQAAILQGGDSHAT